MYSTIQGILNKDTNDIIKVNSNLEVETLAGKKYKGKLEIVFQTSFIMECKGVDVVVQYKDILNITKI